MSIQSDFKGLTDRIWKPTMHITQIQRQECERMFVAGYASCFQRCMAAADLPDDDAEKVLQSIQHEFTDYYRLLRHIPGTEGTERQ